MIQTYQSVWSKKYEYPIPFPVLLSIQLFIVWDVMQLKI